MKKLLAGIAAAGISCGAALYADEPHRASKTQTQMSRDMQEAIAFERAKDAADARQARLEARHPSVSNENANRSADRDREDTNGGKVYDPATGKKKDH